MIGSARLQRGVAALGFAVALGLCAAHGASHAAAQDTAPAAQQPAGPEGENGAKGADAAEQRSQSFQAVRGAVKEDVAGGPLLVIAYAAIWVVLLLYVIRLVRLQQRVLSDVERLERVLSQSSSSR